MNSSSSSSSNNSNFDSLLLQSLMGKMHLRPPYLNTNSYLSQSLEDFLLDANSINQDDDDDNDDSSENDERSLLAKEESKLEKEIIRIILTGKIDTLKPNSGQAVTIGEHHICVGFHQEKETDYRVWEWHGHIMLFDEDNGYTPEYIYGNYFERLIGKHPSVVVAPAKVEKEEEKEEDGVNLGLRELIDGGGQVNGRILRRNNMNIASPKF